MIQKTERKERIENILPKGEYKFDGIIKFLVDESNGNISEKVGITTSYNQEY